MQGAFFYLLTVIIWGSTWFAIKFQLGTVIFSTVIVMNIINGAIFLKKPVQGIVLLGALIGLSGITLVFWQEIQASRSVSVEASGNVLKGLGIGLIATLFASMGNILSARNQSHKLPVLQTNAYGMAYGTFIMLLFALVSGVTLEFEWTAPYIVSLIYLSVFGSIIAFGAYLTLVGRIGADRAAYATVLFPLVALLISSVFEDYTWTPIALVGVVLVLIGNVLVVGRGFVGKSKVAKAVV